MANYSTPESFLEIVRPLFMQIAEYAYLNGNCGHTAAKEFQTELQNAIEKIASAPLTFSSEWSNPMRRSFFEYKGQYTLIFVFKPVNASINQEVQKVIFTNLYPSRSKQGNASRPEEIIFDADEILSK